MIELAPFLIVLMILLAFAVAGLAIFLVIFWIWMLVDVLTRHFKEGTERIAWLLVILILSLIGALLYYFLVFRKKRK